MSKETDRPNNITARTPGQERHTQIDLIDLLGFYMSMLPLLIIVVLLGALASGLITQFFIPDRFTATSRMYMVSASSDSVVSLADLNIGTSLSNDYVELMKTRPVMEDVIDKLGLQYSYEQLVCKIKLSVVPNTRIVRISVTSTDPWEAMDIANQVARTAKIQLPKAMEAPSPTIVEMAVLPTTRSAPSLAKNVAVGALLPLSLVLAVLTVIYRMDDTIKTSEDLEKVFGVMPLSVIPEGRIEGLSRGRDEKSSPDGAERRIGFRKKKTEPKKESI